MGIPNTTNTKNSRSLFGKRRKRKYKYTPAAQNAALAKRELLELLRDETKLPGVGMCFPYKNGYQWPQKATELAQAGFTLRNCGNSHACPVCSSRYMSVRRAQFEAAADEWIAQGGFLIELKLSLKNDTSVPSREKYRGLATTWTRMRNKSRYKALAAALRNPPFVKILEETVSETGIFPHLHIIWLFDKTTTQSQAKGFLRELQKLWCETANRHSLGAQAAGQNIRTLSSDNAEGIAGYYFKHGYYDLDLKPQDETTLDPFGALRRFFATGEMEYLIFWIDFEISSAHQTRVRFSTNFPFLQR